MNSEFNQVPVRNNNRKGLLILFSFITIVLIGACVYLYISKPECKESNTSNDNEVREETNTCEEPKECEECKTCEVCKTCPTASDNNEITDQSVIGKYFVANSASYLNLKADGKFEAYVNICSAYVKIYGKFYTRTTQEETKYVVLITNNDPTLTTVDMTPSMSLYVKSSNQLEVAYASAYKTEELRFDCSDSKILNK